MYWKIETDGHARRSGERNAGRKRVMMKERKRNILVRATTNKVGVSLRGLAQQYDKMKLII